MDERTEKEIALISIFLFVFLQCFELATIGIGYNEHPRVVFLSISIIFWCWKFLFWVGLCLKGYAAPYSRRIMSVGILMSAFIWLFLFLFPVIYAAIYISTDENSFAACIAMSIESLPWLLGLLLTYANSGDIKILPDTTEFIEAVKRGEWEEVRIRMSLATMKERIISNDTPLTVALSHSNVPKDLIEEMIRVYPAIVDQGQSSKAPISIAMDNNCSADIILLLYEKMKTISSNASLERKNSFNKSMYEILFKSIQKSFPASILESMFKIYLMHTYEDINKLLMELFRQSYPKEVFTSIFNQCTRNLATDAETDKRDSLLANAVQEIAQKISDKAPSDVEAFLTITDSMQQTSKALTNLLLWLLSKPSICQHCYKFILTLIDERIAVPFFHTENQKSFFLHAAFRQLSWIDLAVPLAIFKKDPSAFAAVNPTAKEGIPLSIAFKLIPTTENVKEKVAAFFLKTWEENQLRITWVWLQEARNTALSNDEKMLLIRILFETYQDSHPTIVRDFCFAIDEDSRAVINLAHIDIVRVMKEYLYFYGRYELQAGPPLHRSATAIVVAATDDHSVSLSSNSLVAERGGEPLTTGMAPVVLKFMMNMEQYDRELNLRQRYSLDPKYILNVLTTMTSGDDESYEKAIHRRGYQLYRYCLVMPAADRTLKYILDSEHIAGCDWEGIKLIASQLCHAVNYLHSKKILHGDLKPLNIVRMNGVIKLIDLDAAVLMEEDYCGYKWSSAYLPPEMCWENALTGQIEMRQPPGKSSNIAVETLPYRLVRAEPSVDIWSIGVVLFHLCTNEPLWRHDGQDNLDQESLRQLLHWGGKNVKGPVAVSTSLLLQDLRLYMLYKIKNVEAKNLISQLLHNDAERRPRSIGHILAHPFFTGKKVERMVGEDPAYEVFLSYRVASESATVQLFYDLLKKKNVAAWLDVKNLEAGKDWEEGFCAGLANSRIFLPLISRKSIKRQFETIEVQSRCDNVLLEFRLALELQVGRR